MLQVLRAQHDPWGEPVARHAAVLRVAWVVVLVKVAGGCSFEQAG